MKLQIKNTFVVTVTIKEGGKKHGIKVEYNELPLSRMREIEQERRRRQRKLSKAIRDQDDLEVIEQLEAEASAFETELLDEVLVSLPDLELQDADGEVLSEDDKLAFAKDRINWAVPLIEGFTKHITSAATKNSNRPAVH